MFLVVCLSEHRWHTLWNLGQIRCLHLPCGLNSQFTKLEAAPSPTLAEPASTPLTAAALQRHEDGRQNECWVFATRFCSCARIEHVSRWVKVSKHVLTAQLGHAIVIWKSGRHWCSNHLVILPRIQWRNLAADCRIFLGARNAETCRTLLDRICMCQAFSSCWKSRYKQGHHDKRVSFCFPCFAPKKIASTSR